MRALQRASLLTAAILAVTLAPAASIAAEKFDGYWTTTQNCPAEGKMSALIRQIPGTITNGELRGEKGTADEPGHEIITGTIGDNGDAKLTVNGILANRANAHGMFAHQGASYSYTVNAHFDGDQGKGKRNTGLGIESRPCDFTFAKQAATSGAQQG
ncbi:MAG TPA: hypothetical protein VHX37_13705 [Acidobacteriaceae bacterium]|jgi:hypothetical protein|nr:hypothetical protein [Acidobacteriaceae bacterium]